MNLCSGSRTNSRAFVQLSPVGFGLLGFQLHFLILGAEPSMSSLDPHPLSLELTALLIKSTQFLRKWRQHCWVAVPCEWLKPSGGKEGQELAAMWIIKTKSTVCTFWQGISYTVNISVVSNPIFLEIQNPCEWNNVLNHNCVLQIWCGISFLLTFRVL